jgi:tRNA A37 methylthiotransferase MiaB
VVALRFSYLHVCAYSARGGTAAARRPGHVPAAVIRARSERLRRLGREKSEAFRGRLVGTAREVLVLEGRDRRTGLRSGLTANYVEVQFPGRDEPGRRIVTVEITDVQGERTLGRLVEAGA